MEQGATFDTDFYFLNLPIIHIPVLHGVSSKNEQNIYTDH